MGCDEQSVSLLEDSMILLSEDEMGVGDGDEGESPIERTRHCQDDPRPPSTSLAPDDGDAPGSTPPFPARKHPSKRCASHSGKRGFKTRHRGSINEDDDDEDDSLLLGHFDGIGGSGGSGGMFPHDQEDAFSCGSPIRRRFSNDGLESDCCDADEESRDRLHSLPHREDDEIGSVGKYRGDGRKGADANDGEESEGDSRFSLQDDDDDHVSFGGGNGDSYNDEYADDNNGGLRGNSNESDRPGTQNHLSQWNTFRNAEAELTYSQMDDESEDGGSPVRRRAIRFDGASQPLQSQRRSEQRRGNLSGREAANGTAGAAAEGNRPRKQQSSKKANAKGSANDEDDPVQTVRNLCRRAKALEEQGVDSSLLEEVAPIDVRLRDGAHFRMDPLRCRQDKENKRGAFDKKSSKTRKTKAVGGVRPKGKGRPSAESSDSENSLSDPEASFQDPISDFPSRVAARLNAGLSFVIEKEAGAARRASEEESEDDRGIPSAVLLSMTIRQIVCVTSKLLLQTLKPTRLHQRSKNGRPSSSGRRRTPSTDVPTRPKTDDYLAGGTLIVLRGKEDISRWEIALREYTSLSCLDHAGMPSALRKLAGAAGKCAGFDVVLTTYDAIKSKEVTVPVDSLGCAILGSSASGDKDDGWFASRSTQTEGVSGVSAPQKCHQLSVLHRMSWFRVIFMDVLGRKGFLTKPGTARAQAAVAINSQSRLAFFEKDEDATIKVEEKFKDDRRQLRSIITALHLPERMKLDKLIGRYILDVNQVGKVKKGNRRESSSSSNDDEYVSGIESIDDSLTDPW